MSSTSESHSNTGIDIKVALEILSRRAVDGDGLPSNAELHQHHHGACAEHASDEGRTMGQIIDLDPYQLAIQDEQKSLAQKQDEINEERRKRRNELERNLETLSIRELVQAALQAQQQRVRAYDAYNTGLNTVLSTGNLSKYPQVCAEATAHFAVICDTMNCILSCLSTKWNRLDIADMIRKLQQHEKEKLSLSAALHLERIRESQGGEESLLVLLRQGAASLESRISVCVMGVNDVIEELQCILLEEL